MGKVETGYYKRVIKNGKPKNVKITKKEYEKFVRRETEKGN